eukprot:COSAG01_NODE_7145_length_3331_cov_33.812191_3_plen_232_part_00
MRRFADDACACDDGDGVELRSEDEDGDADDDAFINDDDDDDDSDDDGDGDGDGDGAATAEPVGSRCHSAPSRYTDTDHAADMQEEYSDDDERAAAAGTAGSDEDDDSGDGDGSNEEGNDEGTAGCSAGAASVAFERAVRADLMRQGRRYLVWAPAADKGSANGGSVREADRAGLGILSAAGQHAEFRLCSRCVSASTRLGCLCPAVSACRAPGSRYYARDGFAARLRRRVS